MKSKDKKNVDLTALGQILFTIKSQPDSKLDFELRNSLFLFVCLGNINLSLYNTSYFNYNYNLLIFVILFLSRRTMEAVYISYSLRNHSVFNLNGVSVWLVLSVYSLLLTHCIANLFFNYSFSVILTLICPFSAYKLLTTTSTARYLDGCTNCFYHMQQIILNSLEVVYCAGYLPYKYFPATGYYMNGPMFLSTILTTFVCYTGLHIGEFMKKRSAELVLFALEQGDWQKTEEKPIEDWNMDKKYPRGHVVRHKGTYWKAEGRFNTCEPGKYEAQLLSLLFKDPLWTMKRVNILTALCAGGHNFYLMYLPFHYTQVISILLFGYVLTRNIRIFRNLKLPNV